MKSEFDWTSHILELGELPGLTELWERELVEEIKKWIPRRANLKILEIGCSNGRWLRWFKKEFSAETFGVDLNVARASSVQNFILAEGLTLPIKDNCFDVVFSMGLIEHFPNPQLRHKLISEHVRVAKSGTGIVWLEHPNMNFSLSLFWTKLYHDCVLHYKHYRVTDQEMRKHFKGLGVNILATRWLDWFPRIFMDKIAVKLHNHFPFIPAKFSHKIWQRKWIEHPFTADDFLIIGQKE